MNHNDLGKPQGPGRIHSYTQTAALNTLTRCVSEPARHQAILHLPVMLSSFPVRLLVAQALHNG